MRRGRLIIWRVNLASVPRSRGRAVPRSLAVRDPTLDEIAAAMAKLGLEPKPHPEKRYPMLWFDDSASGYVEAEGSSMKRSRVLVEVAKIIKSSREVGPRS